ncbi:DUF5703 domain-containing protein [Paenibacillus cisolokensis]|uniref:DUF5703 domain-containing protein n=1 Tax=Paenibacillus cisolokensis TaxID=1658519 RepID=UPI003D26ECBF
MNLEAYNVVWETPSRHSGESMPAGGHDVGLNVWVEQGDICFYIDRSGSFDENNQMLKLGRVRLRLDPNPFTGGVSFRQELKLREGFIEIAGSLADGTAATVAVRVDALRPVVRLNVEANRPVRVLLAYESWRFREREVPHPRRMCATSMVGYPGAMMTYPDSVQFDGEGVLFFHRNRDEALVFDKLVELQGLGDHRERLWNPQYRYTFGGLMRGDGMRPAGTEEGVYLKTPFKAWKLASDEARERHRAVIALHSEQADSLEAWRGKLDERLAEAEESAERAEEESRQWWRAFWERSRIVIDPDRRLADERPWQVGRNYNLFRYMLGCNARGEYPTKFNGGLFTSDPVHVLRDPAWEEETADFRRWGGGAFTAQNQRLVYWPMLASGDWDMMKPQFEFYRRALGNAELRTRVYWGHGGCSFTEQVENFGLTIGWNWGWPDSPDLVHRRTPFHDPTEPISPWIKYHYVNQLEFAFMILQYRKFSGGDIRPYLPLIESAVRFFDEHYQLMYSREAVKRLDEDGKLVIFPSTAGETYKLAMNPADVVSALDATVRAVLELPDDLLDGGRRTYFGELLDRIPPLSFREREGRRTIAPAKRWQGIINVELPQLYPVFPYGQYGIGRDDLQVAIDTWRYGSDIPEQKNHISWHQDGIFCARLGLTEEAADMAIRKLADGECRFPAFWGPGHDWLPDHNWGGTGMIGLQEMLLQSAGEAIYLLPAWPMEWDVDFRLHAPGRTVVEGRVRGGRLEWWDIAPERRRKDVVVMAQTSGG